MKSSSNINLATKPYAFEEAVTARHRLLLSKVTVRRTRSKTAKRDQSSASEPAKLVGYTRLEKSGGLFAASVYWGGFLQCREQCLGAIWHWHSLLENNGFCANFLAVQVFVGAVVGAKGGTC
jgi:hypothetical protein